MKRPMLFVALALAGTSAVTTAQIEPVRVARQASGFVLEAGEHALVDVVRKAAKFLNRNILINEMEFRSAAGNQGGRARRGAPPAQGIQADPEGPTVLLDRSVEVDARGCEELLSALLYVKGFALLPVEPEKGLYEVISMSGPKANELGSRAQLVTAEDVLRRPNLYEIVLVTVDLKHVNSTVATNSLRPFFAATGGGRNQLLVGNVGNQHAIILQGFRHQVAAAVRLLQTVDTPHPDQPNLERRIADLEQRLQVLEQTRRGGR